MARGVNMLKYHKSVMTRKIIILAVIVFSRSKKKSRPIKVKYQNKPLWLFNKVKRVKYQSVVLANGFLPTQGYPFTNEKNIFYC